MKFTSTPTTGQQFTASDRKIFASLATAKGRKESGLFMAQGTKCVLDTLGHFSLYALLATTAWAENHTVNVPVTLLKPKDLERISTHSTPPEVIAIYRLPEVCGKPNLSGLVLALDCVQDPGNLGTIIRVADWMGVHTILASTDTADCFAPKVIQATMGAISRVKVHYCPLSDALDGEKPVYGTFLDGEDIYKTPLSGDGIIVMGNEGKGITAEVARAVNRRLFIPPYPRDDRHVESLNVSIATAIILSQFRNK